MVSVNGYFDGNVVKPLEKIDAKPNQRVIITIMDEFFTPEPKKDIKSMRGVLAQYADPELAKKEKEAWERAVTADSQQHSESAVCFILYNFIASVSSLISNTIL